MKIPRRRFLKRLTGSEGLIPVGIAAIQRLNTPPISGQREYVPEARTGQGPLIDREALVARHNSHLRKIDPLSPLSLGNGEFAFTADITGLQTFPEIYAHSMPLCTMSQWGWHTSPAPSGLASASLRLVPYETHGRQVGYPTSAEGQSALYTWLRENPHRLHLGRIALRVKTAANQGYVGARWPKMTGTEGRDSPSPTGPLLIRQQPHRIFYAELCGFRGIGCM